MRVGGVCAILAVVSGIVARISFGNAWLTSRGVETLIIGHWFDVLALLLNMAAVLGFYQALRQAGPLLLIAVVAFLTGVIFLLFHEFIQLGIAYELAPGIADTLRQTSRLAAGVGYVLIFVIGVLFVSFAILQTSVVPKWIGWLGLIVVAVHVPLLTLLSDVFESWLWPVATGTSRGWALAMGVVLLRLKGRGTGFCGKPLADVSGCLWP